MRTPGDETAEGAFEGRRRVALVRGPGERQALRSRSGGEVVDRLGDVVPGQGLLHGAEQSCQSR